MADCVRRARPDDGDIHLRIVKPSQEDADNSPAVSGVTI